MRLGVMTKHTKIQSALILDVVVGERTTIFEPCRSEDQTLLVRRNAFLFPDLCLNIVDGVRRHHFQRKRLSAKRLDENTRDTTRTEEKLECRFFPDAIV